LHLRCVPYDQVACKLALGEQIGVTRLEGAIQQQGLCFVGSQ